MRAARANNACAHTPKARGKKNKIIMGEEIQLDFENQMFIELLAQDGMVVLAR